ncbi:hypothetical protein BC937DRAFT_94160 [Endogone sp. FLAS-F59071]|nr:hypothetical protein BC937DRAFT_94160 [Endogone sp. FLAS-F59071]|eukprot:RUS14223.1 hypothetical protein BC937DRAFT_94160 [Endogone sp. FLAS-F59071]
MISNERSTVSFDFISNLFPELEVPNQSDEQKAYHTTVPTCGRAPSASPVQYLYHTSPSVSPSASPSPSTSPSPSPSPSPSEPCIISWSPSGRLPTPPLERSGDRKMTANTATLTMTIKGKTIPIPKNIPLPKPRGIRRAPKPADPVHAEKRQKNTDAARRSRMKKFVKICALQEQVNELEAQNAQLSHQLAVVDADKTSLQMREMQYLNRIAQMEAQMQAWANERQCYMRQPYEKQQYSAPSYSPPEGWVMMQQQQQQRGNMA